MALTNENSTSETDTAVAGTARLSRKGKIATKNATEGAVGPRRSAAAGKIVNPERMPIQSPKAAIVLKKLNSPKGATIEILMEATNWQAHSIRGFLSAVVRKKLGMNLVSGIGKDGVRRYRIDEAASTSK